MICLVICLFRSGSNVFLRVVAGGGGLRSNDKGGALYNAIILQEGIIL